jgi:hypothetical protein
MDAILTALSAWLTLFWVGLVALRLGLMALAVIYYGRTAPVKHPVARRATIGLMLVLPVVWAVIVLALGSRAYFQINRETVPPPPVAIAPTIAIMTGLALFAVWGAYRRIIFNIPYYWIIAFQSLRATGFVFLILYAQGLLPGVFAIPAGIGDIVAGGLALPVAYY